ncbi:MAG: hypothetical protein ACFE95_02160 [Candidatus Hodarchaeota archaeon]
MREQKEWIVQGFKDKVKEKIESKLMDDEYSYWFRYRSIPWYRKRRLKGNSPKETIENALKELQIEALVWKKDQWKQISSYWVIEPK